SASGLLVAGLPAPALAAAAFVAAVLVGALTGAVVLGATLPGVVAPGATLLGVAAPGATLLGEVVLGATLPGVVALGAALPVGALRLGVVPEAGRPWRAGAGFAGAASSAPAAGVDAAGWPLAAFADCLPAAAFAGVAETLFAMVVHRPSPHGTLPPGRARQAPGPHRPRCPATTP